MTLQPLEPFDTLGDPWLPLSLALVGVGESGDPNGEWISSEMVGLWISSLLNTIMRNRLHTDLYTVQLIIIYIQYI